MQNEEILWKKIVTLHLHLKEIILIAEEFSLNYQTFLQPFLEQRNAFDHFMRVKAAQLGLSENTGNEEYVKDNYDKMIGHLYRAFFDAADWLSVSIRERIIENLDGFTNDSINSCIPEYYGNINLEIDQISKEIAGLRKNKDIGKKDNAQLLSEVEKYRDSVLTLFDHLKMIQSCLPSLFEYKEKEANELKKERRFTIISLIVTAFLGAIIGSILTYCFSLLA